MMWRWMVLALVVANGAFWLWSHGLLRDLGWGPVEVSEPARLKSQIQPDSIRVSPQEAAPAQLPATTAETANPALAAQTSATRVAPTALPASNASAPAAAPAAQTPTPAPAKGK